MGLPRCLLGPPLLGQGDDDRDPENEKRDIGNHLRQDGWIETGLALERADRALRGKNGPSHRRVVHTGKGSPPSDPVGSSPPPQAPRAWGTGSRHSVRRQPISSSPSSGQGVGRFRLPQVGRIALRLTRAARARSEDRAPLPEDGGASGSAAQRWRGHAHRRAGGGGASRAQGGADPAARGGVGGLHAVRDDHRRVSPTGRAAHQDPQAPAPPRCGAAVRDAAPLRDHRVRLRAHGAHGAGGRLRSQRGSAARHGVDDPARARRPGLPCQLPLRGASYSSGAGTQGMSVAMFRMVPRSFLSERGIRW